jgi:hypothetical protein
MFGSAILYQTIIIDAAYRRAMAVMERMFEQNSCMAYSLYVTSRY